MGTFFRVGTADAAKSAAKPTSGSAINATQKTTTAPQAATADASSVVASTP